LGGLATAIPPVAKLLWKKVRRDDVGLLLQVVIEEALMLLRRCCPGDDEVTNGNGSSSSSSREQSLRFIEAVANTKSLTRPKYINIDTYKPTAGSHVGQTATRAV